MFDLIIAIDSEYVREGTKNRVLCYSFACANPAKPEDIVTHVYHLNNGMRWQMRGLLARSIAALLEHGFIHRPPTKQRRSKGKTVVDQGRLKILLVAHFSRADLPGFADWKKLKRSFDAVRGTYTTTRNATVVTLYPPGRARLEISVTLADTMLLAPNGYQSLRALGDSLGFEKQDVGDYITRMDQLRDEDLVRFEAYAIRDAEVCLTWVLTFLEFWENDLGFVGKKLPPTIGSAAVQYALKIWESHGVDAGDVCGYTGRGTDRHWIDRYGHTSHSSLIAITVAETKPSGWALRVRRLRSSTSTSSVPTPRRCARLGCRPGRNATQRRILHSWL